ncbi:MAG: OmpL47-type beta-barrel domain-containing protein, partial [Thermoplasmatota archaeon]
MGRDMSALVLMSRSISIAVLAILLLNFISITSLGHERAFDVEAPTREELPVRFDLRSFNGENYVSSVKSQNGGTCWAHGTMAAMESNLMMTGLWEDIGEVGDPNLAEYHLDWWNGFNDHNNDDGVPRSGNGLNVHYGGDYLMSTAYFARGEGAVRDKDGQNFDDPPLRTFSAYHEYYPMHVEWYQLDDELNGIEDVKRALIEYGAIATCMQHGPDLRDPVTFAHYQPPDDPRDPDHSVTIVGWDDELVTPAPEPGAWLCKNSWGSDWGINGYFWISYHDKYAGKHPELGATSFRNVSFLAFDRVYYHDYHGWRDTWTNSTEAFNSFTGEKDEQLQGVSFYTTEDDVGFTVRVYDEFINGSLGKPMRTITGHERKTGFHTYFFDTPMDIRRGDDFHIMLSVSAGGIAFDRTSKVPLVMEDVWDAGPDAWINSTSAPNQSFYRSGSNWEDLYLWNDTSNFCIKGLVGHVSISDPMNGEYKAPGTDISGPVSIQMDKVKVRIDDGPLLNTTIRWGNWSIGLPPGLAEGPHTLTAYGYQDGIMEYPAVTFTGFSIDATPPETTARLAGPEGENGWYLGDVDITLEPGDKISGIASTYYILDRDSPAIYNSTFNSTGDGEHSLEYWSIDVAGNMEARSKLTFRIDTGAPRTFMELSGEKGENDWFISPVNVLFSPEADMSGVNSTFIRVNGGGWERRTDACYEIGAWSSDTGSVEISEEGTYLIEGFCRDQAGNEGPVSNLTFRIDRDPPITDIFVEGTPGLNGWYVSEIKVHLTTRDNSSGVASTYYRFLGGSWDTYSSPLNIRKDGKYTIQYHSVDNGSLKEDWRSANLKIDKVPPTTSMEIIGEEGKNEWFVSPVRIDLFGNDLMSGFNSTWISLDGSDFTRYHSPYIVNTPGLHMVRYYSMDMAGNREEAGSTSFRVDIHPPWIVVNGLPSDGVVRDTNLTLTVEFSDDTESPRIWSFRLDGGDDIIGDDLNTIDLRMMVDGSHSLSITVEDEAGNSNTTMIT